MPSEVTELNAEANDASAADSAIRPVDQLVLDLLRKEPGLKVTDLTERLEVTATAVRQRLDRLESMELIERTKVATQRGRPLFQYALTPLGWRRAGVNYMELAVAMWEVIQGIADDSARTQLVEAVSRRMGQSYATLLPAGTVPERMRAMARLLNERKIPARVNLEDELPILEVQACPFPDLMERDLDNRTICELEQQMLSEAIGQPLELTCCRRDGQMSCHYRTTPHAVPNH